MLLSIVNFIVTLSLLYLVSLMARKSLMERNTKKKSRGFMLLSDDAVMPTRGTSKSAGYDLHAAHDAVIPPGATGKECLVKTDVAAYMEDDEFFMLKSRSGNSYKKGALVGAGVIDADYYYSLETDQYGNIGVVFHNWTSEDLVFKKGDRIAQGIFLNYLVADGDTAGGDRSGGFGSTGK